MACVFKFKPTWNVFLLKHTLGYSYQILLLNHINTLASFAQVHKAIGEHCLLRNELSHALLRFHIVERCGFERIFGAHELLVSAFG